MNCYVCNKSINDFEAEFIDEGYPKYYTFILHNKEKGTIIFCSPYCSYEYYVRFQKDED